MGFFSKLASDASSIYSKATSDASDLYTGALDVLTNPLVMSATLAVATFGTSVAEAVSASDIFAPEIGVPLAAAIEGGTLLAKGASRLELGALALKKMKTSGLSVSSLLNSATAIGS